MRMTVIGCGYLGAVHAPCMADAGHDVVGLDVDEVKVKELSAGRAPFYEPGLPELLERAGASGRLRFTTEVADVAPAAGHKGARQADQAPTIHFVCVGTPQRRGEYAADTSYVDRAVADLVPHLRPGDLVVGKSTVPVGTAARLAATLAEQAPGVLLAWNPEFLREAYAVEDTLHPDRLVFGTHSTHALDVLEEIYALPLSDRTPVVRCDIATAELIKVAANSFLATKISFINAMAQMCQAAGGDVTLLADAIGFDKRIGREFLNAGLGFGGGCLPKDIAALAHRADELGVHVLSEFIHSVEAINDGQRSEIADLAIEQAGGDWQGPGFAPFRYSEDRHAGISGMSVNQITGETTKALTPVLVTDTGDAEITESKDDPATPPSSGIPDEESVED